MTKTDSKKHFTQDSCLKGIDLKDYHKNFFYATDTESAKGTKTFSRINFGDSESGLNKVRELLKSDFHNYEWVTEDSKLKLYFDCEMEGEEFTKAECEIRMDLFVNFVCHEINLLYKSNLKKEDFIWLNSCRTGKLSYHIVLNKNFYFENMGDHKNFIDNWLTNKFLQQPEEIKQKLIWKQYSKKDSTVYRELFIFDRRVYNPNQKIRCVNQSKKGKFKIDEEGKTVPIIITLDDPTIDTIDSLVVLYEGVGDRRKIDLVYTKTDIETRKSKGKGKGKGVGVDTTVNTNSIEDEYIVTGLTIKKQREISNDDILKLPLYEQYLCLIPNNDQTFRFYSLMSKNLFLLGAPKSLFIEWARLYVDYKENCFIIKQYGLKVAHDKEYDPIFFLKKYAKKSDVEFFNSEKKLLHQYFAPDYGALQIINEKSFFVSEKGTSDEHNIENEAKIILIHADLGAGKTTAIKRVILQQKYSKILVLTPRIAYCNHVVTEFGVSNYLDGKYDCDKLACSLESLWKIQDSQIYDVVIIDECEAILSIFSSTTIKRNQLKIYNKLKLFINNSKKTFFAGAFITQKSIDFIQSFECTKIVIKSNRPKIMKKAVEIFYDDFITVLINYIRDGGKPYVYWASKKQGDIFVERLRGRAEDNEILKQKLENMLYYKSGDDDTKLNGLLDINNVWDRASFVMSTPTITVGNSYSPKNTTFTSSWIYGFPSCITADIFQGNKRCRHTTTNILYYCLPSQKLLTMINQSVGNIVATLVLYDSITTENRQFIIDSTKNRMDKIKDSKYNGQTEQYELIINSLTTDFTITPEPLRRLLFQNALEINLSKKYFITMYHRFLDIIGYEYKTSKLVSTNELNDQILIDKENTIELKTIYENILLISEEEKDRLKYKIERSRATHNEKLEVRKFFFLQQINTDLPATVLAHYFELSNDIATECKFNNLFQEANIFTDNAFHKQNNVMNLKTTENIKFSCFKLEYIRAINKKLGIENSLDKSVISIKKIEEIGEYLSKERISINKVFKLRDQSKSQEHSLINTINLLKKIYSSWCDSKFKKTEKGLDWQLVSYYQNFPPYKWVINNNSNLIAHEPITTETI